MDRKESIILILMLLVSVLFVKICVDTFVEKSGEGISPYSCEGENMLHCARDYSDCKIGANDYSCISAYKNCIYMVSQGLAPPIWEEESKQMKIDCEGNYTDCLDRVDVEMGLENIGELIDEGLQLRQNCLEIRDNCIILAELHRSW